MPRLNVMKLTHKLIRIDHTPSLQVYNITPYLKFHPGGEKILRSVYGKDGTASFEKYHRWVNAPALIGRLAVGRLAQPAEGAAKKRASSEDEES